VFADVVSIYKFSRTRRTALNNKVIITIITIIIITTMITIIIIIIITIIIITIIIIINATYSWDHLHTQDTTTASGPPCHHLSSFFENFNLKKITTAH